MPRSNGNPPYPMEPPLRSAYEIGRLTSEVATLKATIREKDARIDFLLGQLLSAHNRIQELTSKVPAPQGHTPTIPLIQSALSSDAFRTAWQAYLSSHERRADLQQRFPTFDILDGGIKASVQIVYDTIDGIENIWQGAAVPKAREHVLGNVIHPTIKINLAPLLTSISDSNQTSPAILTRDFISAAILGLSRKFYGQGDIYLIPVSLLSIPVGGPDDPDIYPTGVQIVKDELRYQGLDMERDGTKEHGLVVGHFDLEGGTAVWFLDWATKEVVMYSGTARSEEDVKLLLFDLLSPLIRLASEQEGEDGAGDKDEGSDWTWVNRRIWPVMDNRTLSQTSAMYVYHTIKTALDSENPSAFVQPRQLQLGHAGTAEYILDQMTRSVVTEAYVLVQLLKEVRETL